MIDLRPRCETITVASPSRANHQRCTLHLFDEIVQNGSAWHKHRSIGLIIPITHNTPTRDWFLWRRNGSPNLVAEFARFQMIRTAIAPDFSIFRVRTKDFLRKAAEGYVHLLRTSPEMTHTDVTVSLLDDYHITRLSLSTLLTV